MERHRTLEFRHRNGRTRNKEGVVREGSIHRVHLNHRRVSRFLTLFTDHLLPPTSSQSLTQSSCNIAFNFLNMFSYLGYEDWPNSSSSFCGQSLLFLLYPQLGLTATASTTITHSTCPPAGDSLAFVSSAGQFTQSFRLHTSYFGSDAHGILSSLTQAPTKQSCALLTIP